MGLTPFDYYKRQEEFIESIIIFVYEHLCRWRNSKNWLNNENEKELNSDLVKGLEWYARTEGFPANFFTDEPQEGKRTVDLIACHYDKNIENFDEAITVFECKRLSSSIRGKRKDEYVTGHEDTGGGIQRFKLEAHGKDHNIAGMIGYIQTGTSPEWLESINNCINGLSDKPDWDGLIWSKNEQINTIKQDEKTGKYHGKSLHPRQTKSDITIHHLWVNMQGEP